MNIIQVCPYDLSIPGGVQTHVTQLSNELVRKNNKVVVFAPSPSNPGSESEVNCEIKHLTSSTRIPWWGTSIDVSVLKPNEKSQILQFFDEFKPDIIHFHTIWNPVMQTQLLWMLPSSVKKVGTFHDTPPDRGLGKYIGANLMKAGAKYYLPKMDEIISVSETQTKAMGADPNSLPDNFRILPNGIDAESAKTIEKESNPDDEFRMIFIGRFENRKGVFELLEIYRRLQSEMLTKKISLKLIGNGPQYSEMNGFINEHSLDGVTIHKDVNDQEKNRLLLNSDLMIAPALYGESFGIVLLEAMALGVRVIGYGNEGYLTIGEKYGIENFPSPGNRDALFALVKQHIKMSAEAVKKLTSKGLDIAAEHDWKLIAQKIEYIYSR
ncbi:glycosyltransferase family 4 protein [Gracilimonas sp. BCB1]|uniref:glycosyltransferase family 4 protein n=1 Tax=Gracilimonas sp. BCB1 TaxID=3152362 RepID=UPI0032D9391F